MTILVNSIVKVHMWSEWDFCLNWKVLQLQLLALLLPNETSPCNSSTKLETFLSYVNVHAQALAKQSNILSNIASSKCWMTICRWPNDLDNNVGWNLLDRLARASNVIVGTSWTIMTIWTGLYIEDITWPCGHTEFIFECWEISHEWAQRTSAIFLSTRR